MSYCRWSCLNFSCDVYVYESVHEGYITHVAGMRYVGDVPRMPVPTPENKDEYMAARNAQLDFLERAERVVIGLPHDGKTFYDSTPDECADRLEELKTLGYNVPQYAIDTLREEAKEDEA